MKYQKYPFELPKLPYEYDSLEPFIDKETLHFHHDKHFQTYVNNLNDAIKNCTEVQNLSLEEMLRQLNSLPEEIRTAVKNNGGGVYNHDLYFKLMTSRWQEKPEGNLSAAINDKFSSYENFKSEFKKIGLSTFGSGYSCLVCDDKKEINIISLSNQETAVTLNLTPILLLDVWEHSYYLKYKNSRADYIDAWFNLVNWMKAEELFSEEN